MNASHETPDGSARIPLLPILAVNFVGTLGFSLVLPFLVFLVTRWGGNALVYGIMGATYSAFQLVGAPILGRWSDRIGRRRILLLSQLGTLVSWTVFLLAFALPTRPLLEVDSRLLGSFALTLPLVVMFVARATDGLTGGNVSVANAYLADVTTEEERSANFGKMAVASNLGFVLGPAIAGLLGGTPWGELLPVLAALAVSALASAIIAFRLPESRPTSLSRDPSGATVPKVFGQEQKPCIDLDCPDLSPRQILALPRVGAVLAVYFLIMLAFSFYYVSFPIHAASGLSWPIERLGLLFSVLGLAMALTQGPLLGSLSKRLSDPVLATVGGVLLAASFPFFGGPEIGQVYLGVALLALGNGLLWPSVLSMLSKAAGETYQGTVQGFAGSLGSVASILGFLLGGVLYARTGDRVFLVSAALVVPTVLVALGFVAAGSFPSSSSKS